MTIIIRRATDADIRPLVTILTEAFLAGPVANWLIPDPHHRRPAHQRYFELVAYHGLLYGQVHLTTDLSAATICYDRAGHAPPPPEFTSPALEWAAGRYAHRFAQLGSTLATHHPQTPHRHLAVVGVKPDYQGHGTGTALIEHHHRIDPTGTPTYLHATTTRDRDLYQHLGYSPQPPLTLPDNGPTIWPMWRPRPHQDGPTPDRNSGS